MALKDEYFTVTQVAKKLSVTRQTVYRWIASKQLNAERIGREMLISREDFDNFEEQWLFSSMGSIALTKLEEFLKRKFREEGITITKIEHKPDEPHYIYLVTEKDGTQSKMTVKYDNWALKDNPKDPNNMTLTLNFKLIEEKMSSKKIGGSVGKLNK